MGKGFLADPVDMQQPGEHAKTPQTLSEMGVLNLGDQNCHGKSTVGLSKQQNPDLEGSILLFPSSSRGQKDLQINFL